MSAVTRFGRTVAGAVAAWALVASACTPGGGNPIEREGAIDPEYRSEWERWRSERREALMEPDGWLTLTGLLWLDAGENTFGAGADNDVVFPPAPSLEGRPATLGTLHRSGLEVLLESAPEASLLFADRPVVEPALLHSADGGSTGIVALGSLRFLIIERGGELAIRLRDLESEQRHRLGSIETYPLSPAWRVQARFEAAPEGHALSFPNILGRDFAQASAGTVVFAHGGRDWRLDTLGDSATEPLLLVVGDETNGDATYGGGRYVYVEVADDGAVDLDFNRLYNPPCVFTPFATCPLPPPQNRLPFAIEAGERKYGHGPKS